MNNIIDDIATTLRQWSTELTMALATAGLAVTYESHKGISSVRLGRLTVIKPGTDAGIKYVVDFERKLVIKKDQRRFVTQVEVYNPVGGLHVYLRNYTPESVLKIVGYAKQTIEAKQAKNEKDDAQQRRHYAGLDLLNKELQSFPVPEWVRVRPNDGCDEDVGTFRMVFIEHRSDWPLARLTTAQVKNVILALQAVNQTPAPMSGWQPVSIPVPDDLQSTTTKTKMLLLAVEGHEQPVRGFFVCDFLPNAFYVEGSLSNPAKPTHWMPLPEMPK